MSQRFNNLHDFYFFQLRETHDAENQMIDFLPWMAENASFPQLKEAFKNHAEQSRQHRARLEQIFSRLAVDLPEHRNPTMEGMVKDIRERLQADSRSAALDAALIAAANKLEHYEIAAYGTLCAFARQMGMEAEAKLLHQTLEEEKQADANFSALAMEAVNPRAQSAGSR